MRESMLVIRTVAPADLDAWVALRTALWPDEPADDLRSEATMLLRDPPAAMGAWLAWDESGAAVGLLEWAVRPSAPGSEGRPIPWIEGWYVVPAARRRGVGRALVAHFEEWARAARYTALGSDTLPLVYTTSPAAHAALGFVVVAEGPDEEGAPALFFQKRLSATAVKPQQPQL